MALPNWLQINYSRLSLIFSGSLRVGRLCSSSREPYESALVESHSRNIQLRSKYVCVVCTRHTHKHTCTYVCICLHTRPLLVSFSCSCTAPHAYSYYIHCVILDWLSAVSLHCRNMFHFYSKNCPNIIIRRLNKLVPHDFPLFFTSMGQMLLYNYDITIILIVVHWYLGCAKSCGTLE